MSKEYNGWTNYATWRSKLRNTMDRLDEVLVNCDRLLKETVEDVVFSQYELG